MLDHIKNFFQYLNTKITYRVIVLIIHLAVGAFYISLMAAAYDAEKSSKPEFCLPNDTGKILGIIGIFIILYHIPAAYARISAITESPK